MTNWLPSLDIGTGPLYVRIADEAENAIKSGALPNGAKLPPQRDLAYDVGVTIGTISRAYALLRERGLVTGEVLTAEQHPNADKLKKTTVNVGGERALNIVCGAANVAAGQKVVVAIVGQTPKISMEKQFAL